MSLIVNLYVAMVGFFLGLFIYFAPPWFVADKLPDRFRHRLCRIYFRQIPWALRRGVAEVREGNAGVQLIKSRFDSEKGAGEKIKHGKEDKHFADAAGYMSYLYNYPFGVVYEKWAVIAHPLAAEVGSHIREYVDDGRDELSSIDEWGRCALGRVVLPRASVGVNLKHFEQAIFAGVPSTAIGTSYDYTETSVERLKDNPRTVQYMTLVVIFAMTMLAVYLLVDFMSGLSQGERVTDAIPIFMGWGL